VKTLDLNKTNLDNVVVTVKRFLLNNQYRLPIRINIKECEALTNIIIGVLENNDFKFTIKDSDIIVLE
jgi:hypothetical protein